MWTRTPSLPLHLVVYIASECQDAGLFLISTSTKFQHQRHEALDGLVPCLLSSFFSFQHGVARRDLLLDSRGLSIQMIMLHKKGGTQSTRWVFGRHCLIDDIYGVSCYVEEAVKAV